ETTLARGMGLLWSPVADPEATCVRLAASRSEHRRHMRKYAEGDMGQERSFYFRGPDAALNLRARNLLEFARLAYQVSDEVWEFHLRHGDYSRWVLGTIGDRDLADALAAVETNAALTPAESREAIREAIEARYTVPG